MTYADGLTAAADLVEKQRDKAEHNPFLQEGECLAVVAELEWLGAILRETATRHREAAQR